MGFQAYTLPCILVSLADDSVPDIRPVPAPIMPIDGSGEDLRVGRKTETSHVDGSIVPWPKFNDLRCLSALYVGVSLQFGCK